MITYRFDGGGPRFTGGPCGWGWVAYEGYRETAHGHGGIESTTNNVAEYTALIMAMTHALACEYDPEVEFAFEGDSKLVVMQTQGAWKVKAAHLWPWRDEAQHLWNGLRRPRIQWISRDENQRADMLATQGRDNYVCALDVIEELREVKHFKRL